MLMITSLSLSLSLLCSIPLYKYTVLCFQIDGCLRVTLVGECEVRWELFSGLIFVWGDGFNRCVLHY